MTTDSKPGTTGPQTAFDPFLGRVPLSQLGLSDRAYNALARSGLKTIGDLAQLSFDDILRVRSVGELIAREIETKLTAFLRNTPAHEEDSPYHPYQIEPGGRRRKPEPPDEWQEKHSPLAGDTSPIAALGLSRRTYNALFRAGCQTVGRVASLTLEELNRVRNVGPTAIAEIEAALATRLLRPGDWHIEPSQPQTPESATAETIQAVIRPELLAVLAQAPLHDIPIGRLALPHNAQKLLAAANVHTVGALIDRPRLIQYHETIHRALETYLTWLARQDVEKQQSETNAIDISPIHRAALRETTLQEVVEAWLDGLPELRRDILLARYGFYAAPLTLAEVGELFGFTRERARQIETKALRELQRRYQSYGCVYLIRPFAALLRDALIEHGGLMTAAEFKVWINAGHDIELGDLIRPQAVLELLADVDDAFVWLGRTGVLAHQSIPAPLIDDVRRALRGVLQQEMRPLTESELWDAFRQTDAFSTVAVILTDRSPLLSVEHFVRACARTADNFEKDARHAYRPRRWGKSILDEIVAALREIGQPAHFTHITERVNALLPPDGQAKPHNVHALLGRYVEYFARVGHGIFGLVEWGLNNDGNLANAAARVLGEAGRPLNIDVITREVLKTWQVNAGSVLAAVVNDERFAALGSGVFALRAADGTANRGELDFADLYGQQLTKLQDEFQAATPRSSTRSPDDELDDVRGLGLDFFARD